VRQCGVGQIVTVFRSRLRPEAGEACHRQAVEMATLAASMPGYVDHKTFAADDGERVTIVTFADQASHDAWKMHADHRMAQRDGVSFWYDEYSIAVAQVVRSTAFERH
jgi:heme-degrading monooxygenase HmoA